MQYKGYDMKKILMLSIGLGLILFTGCGSSSSTKTETHTEGGGTSGGTTGGTDGSTGGEESIKACAVDGNTVVVDEGATCKDGDHTLSCQDNIVTLDGAIHAQTINMNGRTYTCN